MNRSFADQYGHLEQWHWWFRGRQRLLETILHQELGGQPSASIISLGCGPAEGLQWLTPFAGDTGAVVGLDVETLHARRNASGVEYVVGALETVPFRSGQFDVVLALDVLEHLDQDAVALREAARLRKPQGLLCVTVPALPSLWGQQDEISHHKRRYTKPMLLETFARAELSRPRISYFNTILFPPIAVMRWLRAMGGRRQATRSDFEDNKPGVINDCLASVFALERHLVYRVPFPFGVSLLATLRS
jgi:SAM-dependent methyltransferase